MAGRGIITGQHTQTRPCEETVYIHEKTGAYPLLQGFELLAYSPNINYADASKECLTEVEEEKGTMETALAWTLAHPAGIVTICFHWFSPLGGRDKSFYARNTDFDPAKVLEEGTAERTAFYRDLEAISIVLKAFADHHVPVLWRPFHEAEGDWFWWGRKGDATARELYKMMFDFFVHEKGLHNLLWVWNSPTREGYPGDAYVDVISMDIYVEPHTVTDYAAGYARMREQTRCRKVAALAECGVLPDVDMLRTSHVPWAYYMTWSKEFYAE